MENDNKGRMLVTILRERGPLLVTILLGTVAGIVVGYFARVSGSYYEGGGRFPFDRWLTYIWDGGGFSSGLFYNSWGPWAILGGLFATGVALVRKAS